MQMAAKKALQVLCNGVITAMQLDNGLFNPET
jgi:hypothetical protein